MAAADSPGEGMTPQPPPGALDTWRARREQLDKESSDEIWCPPGHRIGVNGNIVVEHLTDECAVCRGIRGTRLSLLEQTSDPSESRDDRDDRQVARFDQLRSRLVTRDQLRDIPRPGYLIDTVLPASSVALIYGRPGVGKSFLVVDWACSIASKCWWLGREVVQGPVLSIVAEGVFGIDPRVAAWEQARGVTVTGGVQWLKGAVNLLDQGWVNALVDLADEIQPVLTVVDTLARCLVGGDENSARDVGIAVDAVDRIRQTTMGTAVVVHHAGRDGGNARGSSALDGAADTIIEVRANGDTGMKLVCEKQKDDGPFEDIFVERVKVGESCALYCQSDVAVPEDLARSEAALLETVMAVVGSEGMSSTALQRVSEMSERTFYRSRKALVEKGLLLNIGTDSQPRWVAAADRAS